MNAPRAKGQPSRAAAGATDEPPPCRLKRVFEWLCEVGPITDAGPVSHAEIEAWQRNTGMELDAWTARAIRSMSVAYINEHRAAADPGRPSPYVPEVTPEQQREQVARQFKNAMAAYFIAKGGVGQDGRKRRDRRRARNSDAGEHRPAAEGHV